MKIPKPIFLINSTIIFKGMIFYFAARLFHSLARPRVRFKENRGKGVNEKRMRVNVTLPTKGV